MLAEVLLQVHNTQHLLDFFRHTREHIRAGTFPELREKMASS
jgi:queuine/archaeosine tRNA-ribosyltransferase